MNKITLECWFCGHKFEVEYPPRELGVKCPKCGSVIPYPELPL